MVVAAALALLTSIPSSALPLLHETGDDPCGSIALQHDGTAHQIGDAVAPDASSHCSICHLWHSGGRFTGASLPSTVGSLISLGEVTKTRVGEPGPAATASRPARAPPNS